MAEAKDLQFSLKVAVVRESYRVLYAEADSEFADVLFSFLKLPLGTVVRLLTKHYGENAPVLGSLNSLYVGLQNMDSCHFWTPVAKQMLLNPRNPSEIQCSKLEFKIDDNPPIQCFVCWNGACASMYDNVKCLCPNSTNTMTKRALEFELQDEGKGVFTVPTASFLLTDDLQILPNSPASLLRILKLKGIEDTSVLEERTLTVGLKEIMELLKGSLISKTPLTDMILSVSSVAADKRKRFSTLAYQKENALPLNLSTQKFSDSKNINIKVLVHKSTNKVLVAQTRQDFIDFLFSLLIIPLGKVQSLLGNNTSLGSISNLYRSISSLEIGEYIKSCNAISRLLEPRINPYYLSFYQMFSLTEQSSPELYKLRDSNRVKLFLSTPNNIWRKMRMIDPKGQDSFVKGPTTFMVTDDLVVSTPSPTFILSILTQMKIPVSDIEEVELAIGMEEALRILKATLTCRCALTKGLKPFLKKESSREK